jgi:hypothetical protein
MGEQPEYDTEIRKVALGSGSTTHSTGEWYINFDLLVAGMPNLGYPLTMEHGQLIYVLNPPRGKGAANHLSMAVNPFCANDMTKRAWLTANASIPAVRDEMRGVAPNGDLPDPRLLGDDDNRRKLVALLEQPEHLYKPFFDSTSTLAAKQDGFSVLPYLCKRGIVERFNPMGVVTVPPLRQYGPSEMPRTGGTHSTAVTVEGTCEMQNIWGARAQRGAHLWEVITRDKIRDRRGEWAYGQFCRKFWANPHQKTTEGCPYLEYIGLNQKPQVAHTIYRGVVTDLLDAPLPDSSLRIAWGLGDTTIQEAQQMCKRAGRLRALLVSPKLYM